MWRVINSFLEALEKSIVRANKWSYIPNSEEKMLYINPYLYKGKPVTLNDGTKIEVGDLIGEIHIDNIKVKAVDTEYRNMMKILFNEIYALKNAILDGHYNELKAIYGMTALYPLVKRNGFTIIDADDKVKSWLVTYWEHILRIAFRQKKFRAKKRIRKSKQVWLSRNQILEAEHKQEKK